MIKIEKLSVRELEQILGGYLSFLTVKPLL